MDVKNLAELSKIADLCRKKGIETIKITQDCVEFKLSADVPKKAARKSKKDEKSDPVEEGLITAEDILFWSSQGIPSEGMA